VKGIPAGTPVVAGGEDGFVRYRLWMLKKVSGSNVGKIDSYYVQGSDLAMKVLTGFTPNSSQWQKFDLSNNKLVGDLLSVKPTKKKQDGRTDDNWALVEGDKWVLLRLDSGGAVVGVGEGGAGVFASSSCATSLVGAAVIRTLSP